MIDYFSPSEDPAIPGPRAPSGQKNATAPPGVDTEKAAANATGGEEARDETALEALNANVKETDMKGGEDEDAEYDTLLLEDYRYTFARTEGEGRPLLDFVREKVSKLKDENRKLKDRVADLEISLSILQMAQSWDLSKKPFEQQRRLRELSELLQQAQKAKEEALNFSKHGRGALLEQLRMYQGLLRTERREKQRMKERLSTAFGFAKKLKEESAHQRRLDEEEREAFAVAVRELKERHAKELEAAKRPPGPCPRCEKLKDAVAEMNDMEGLKERMSDKLTELQTSMNKVRQETVEAGELAPEDGDDTRFEDSLLPSGTTRQSAGTLQRSREEGTSAASVSQNHNASVESGATGGSGSAKAKKSKKKGEKEKEKGAHNERLLKKAADLQAQVNEVEAKLQKQKSAGAAGGALDTDQAPGLFGLGGGGSPHAAEGGGSSPPGSSGKEKETIKKSHTTAGGAPSSKVQLDPKLNASADPATFLGAIGGGPVAGEEEQPTSSGNDGGGAEGGGQPWSFLTSQ